jgi:hypothetical protein
MDGKRTQKGAREFAQLVASNLHGRVNRSALAGVRLAEVRSDPLG